MPPVAVTFAVLGIEVAVVLALTMARNLIVVDLFGGKLKPGPLQGEVVLVSPSTQTVSPAIKVDASLSSAYAVGMNSASATYLALL